mmetsp:Transcript_29182/g.54818  ORF Transcript_29182/g.54818 Transcript_29182/m.54818 type:complete len:123 (+) Transcript_29182:28-396(+)
MILFLRECYRGIYLIRFNPLYSSSFSCNTLLNQLATSTSQIILFPVYALYSAISSLRNHQSRKHTNGFFVFPNITASDNHAAKFNWRKRHQSFVRNDVPASHFHCWEQDCPRIGVTYRFSEH